MFLKGCPLRCRWCHSPETQLRRPEIVLHRDRCIHCGSCALACGHGAVTDDAEGYGVDRTRCQRCGTCAEVCPAGARELVGRTVTVDDVLLEIERDVPFYDQSGGGVTLSGGEPLHQPAFTEQLLRRCTERRITTAVETCGFVSRDALLRVARWTTLFLYDLKVVDERRHLRATGRTNARILDNLRTLATRHPQVRVRVPLVPGINDDRQAVRDLGAFLSTTRVHQVDVLPYHRAGVAKYARLDRHYPLDDIAIPDADVVADAIMTLREYGLDAEAGGAR